MSRFYTGVGSRRTPISVLKDMETLGILLAEKGLTLRSGHSEGADLAFEEGCNKAGGNKEIYLPWKGFGRSDSDRHTISEDAYLSVDLSHPSPKGLTEIARRLLARNYHQVVGYDSTKSLFVVCWTPRGIPDGGTGQTIRVAESFNIPVFNLAIMETNRVLKEIEAVLVGE